jgi:hypothetical protein
MTKKQVTIVAAVLEFFASEPYGRKVEILEFKALSFQDKVELREMLIAEGYDIAEIAPPKSE